MVRLHDVAGGIGAGQLKAFEDELLEGAVDLLLAHVGRAAEVDHLLQPRSALPGQFGREVRKPQEVGVRLQFVQQVVLRFPSKQNENVALQKAS